MSNKLAVFIVMAILIASISSCKIYLPTFKTVNNLQFERLGTKGLKLGANVVFNNPNRVRCKVSDVAVDVIVNKKLIGTLGEKTDIIVARKSDFNVPIGILVKPDGTLLDDIKLLFGIITNKEADLFLVGKIKIKVLGITFPVDIKYQQKINLGQVK